MYPPFPEFNWIVSPIKIFLECNENSQTSFYCMLGFLTLLAGISFLVAFKARKLPDRYNESKWIVFSMMVFLSVWTSFLPAYLSTRGKNMVAVEIFAILSSSTGVLACIFLPKCYIVLLTRESGNVRTLNEKFLRAKKPSIHGHGSTVVAAPQGHSHWLQSLEAFWLSAQQRKRKSSPGNPCQLRFQTNGYQCALAMVFATEEINQNPKILPNVTLGFRIFDSCHTEAMATQGVIWMLSGDKAIIPNYRCQPATKMAAIVGDQPSSVSIQVARILGLQRIPQISYASSLLVLGDKLQFPSFLRTVGSIESVPSKLADLLSHFGWTWVGILFSSTDYGVDAAQALKTELASLKFCVAFFETLSQNDSPIRIQYLVNIIRTSSAVVIIVHGYPMEIGPVLEEMVQAKARKVWIFGPAITGSSLFFNRRLWEMLNGTIGFTIPNLDIPSFREFQYKNHPTDSSPDIFLRPFWEHVFDCEWKEGPHKTDEFQSGGRKPCLGSERLESLPISTYDFQNMRISYCTYNAVYALAHALHDLLSCDSDRGNCSSFADVQPWQVPRSVCSNNCPPGYRKVSQKGRPVCCFHCVPCPEGEISNETDAISCIKCPQDHWSNQRRDQCIRRVVEFLSFDDTLGAWMGAAAIFLSVTVSVVLVIFFYYRHSPIVKANNRGLSYILLISLILCCLCSLIFIGKPTELHCILRQTAFGLVFSFCVACILTKTTMVLVAFRALSPDSIYRRWLGHRTPAIIIVSCVSVQTIICISWVSMYPPFPEFNWKHSPTKILLECNENSRTAFYCMLGFLTLLAGISFLVAFQARKLPDRYNESKWIVFSMMVFLSVWTSFLPAYLSTLGKKMVAVEIFAILSSSTGVLACIFLPKCYIILLKREFGSVRILNEKFPRANKKL
ncbi:taste receptor type 1 member 2 [Microcaecilia unicolor]|uniref:Taste receptor type 1 member 2-like n=1 Tax=Microcaecilia unicolor TaxID=1415580 RepID=A0A6P7XBE7_9AMPH|nr:taste receptor type 1 member 2-like [Microcaecilia unicolor]